MTIMQSFLTFFYILDQGYEQYQEDDLGGLLGATSPEIWNDGHPMDKAIYNDWIEICNPDLINEQNIIEKTYDFLDYYEKKFGFNFEKTKHWLAIANNQIIENAILNSIIAYEKYGYKDQ